MKKVILAGGVEVNKRQAWTCTVGFADVSETHIQNVGCDFEMRMGVLAAFVLLFGWEPDFISSGWNADNDATQFQLKKEEN